MGADSSIQWSHINFGQMGKLLVKVEWGWKRLIVRQRVNCSAAPSHLPTNHYNHGESPHLKACLRTSNLACAAQTSCKSLDGYKHHHHKRHHWHRTTIGSALLIHFRTEGVTQSDVIGFSMRPGDSLPSQHQAICARISPQIPNAQTNSAAVHGKRHLSSSLLQ